MRTGVFLAVVLAAAACERETSRPVDPQPASPAPKREEPATVCGVVRWKGAPIAASRIPMSEEFRAAWNDLPPMDPRFEVASDGALPHAFVWAVSGPHRGRKWETPETKVELRGERGMFVPHVFGVMCGQPVDPRSTDNHYNFHAFPRANRNHVNVCIDRNGRAMERVSHRPLADQGAKLIRFDQPEMAILIAGDVYTWMQSYVFVLDHPFFAATDAAGRFEIRGLPPGEYVFRVWHEPMTADVRAHETETAVTLASGATADISVELR